MGIGGVTPAMKLKMAASFYSRAPLEMGGLPSTVKRLDLRLLVDAEHPGMGWWNDIKPDHIA